MLTRRSIIQKTIEVGSSTMTSRLLGIIREIWMVQFLGVGPIAEAFITAFKIPNSLRKIFSEGALTVALIPTLVNIAKEGKKDQINKLITLSIIIFEGFLITLCLFVIFKAEAIIQFIAPGWFFTEHRELFSHQQGFFATIIACLHSLWCSLTITTITTNEKVIVAALFLRILMGLIVTLSTSSLLAGALQAVNHFFIPALSPVLLNLVFIGGILWCLFFHLSPLYLCFFIMAGGVLQLLLHIIAYLKLGFQLAWWDQATWNYFKHIWHKFLPCLFSMSIMELYVFIDTSLASYFPGSIATLYYADRFMLIPLGVIASALSTTLLPHFSRIGIYAPKRLSFYLLETTKLMVWIIIPISFLMGFVSHTIFSTLFLSEKFTLTAVNEAGTMLIILLCGLLFFSLNKILLNIYYGLHETKLPSYISLAAILSNVLISYLLMSRIGAYGIAIAITLAGFLQTVLFLFFLRYRFKFIFYGKNFSEFISLFLLQFIIASLLFYGIYTSITMFIAQYIPIFSTFLLIKWGFWLWYIPLSSILMIFLFATRTLFKIRLYFID